MTEGYKFSEVMHIYWGFVIGFGVYVAIVAGDAIRRKIKKGKQ